jgi:hypothetical protein
MHNLFDGEGTFFNRDEKNFVTHFIESGVFESSNDLCWKLRLQPGNWPNEQENGVNKTTPSQSKLCIIAIPSQTEL